MNVITVNSLDIPELAPYARLTEAQLRRAGEGEGLFIAESVGVIGSAMKAGHRPVSFLCEKSRLREIENSDLCFGDDVPVYVAEDELLHTLTGFHLSRGVLSAMERLPLPKVETICEGKRRVAVLEGISDSTNIGAIFRSAAALGVEAVLVCSSCCDPLNRRAARVSMGTVFLVPWTVMPCVGVDHKLTDMQRLHAMGFSCAALALDKKAIALNDPALELPERLAILLGSEGYGLARETIEASEQTVIIPMSNGVDSLNVAAASAVAFWVLAADRRN